MSASVDPTETILIVDDEEPVRRTFQEWLIEGGLSSHILTAADAEEALQLADRHIVDLAILDWALGAGDDGLQLLQDLYEFNPDVVAIMITGFANQATPLDAMRMGVRDYLDKNHDLNRETFLRAVRHQLEHIRPLKRDRRLHQSLVAFREAVEKILPLVQSAAALNDPVPLPEAIGSLFRFLKQAIGARDGVLLVRHYDADRDPPEVCRAYDASGKELEGPLVPFARSVAASALSLQEPCAMNRLDQVAAAGAVELQPFEQGRHSLLAAPLSVAPGVQVVLELLDKQVAGGASDGGFTSEDHRLMRAAAGLGTELLRQALAQRQTHQVLLDAVAAALGASTTVAETLRGNASERLEQPAPVAVMDRLREGLSASATTGTMSPDSSLRLAEAIRVLALRHGPPAVEHCTRLVESLRELLDKITGS
jgi:two-component system, NtrC family, nitrogen regulation response regulator NtrX